MDQFWVTILVFAEVKTHLKQAVYGRGGSLSQQTHPLPEQSLVVELTALRRQKTQSFQSSRTTEDDGGPVNVSGTYRASVLQLPQVDVLHSGLEGAQTVAQLVFSRAAEAEVPDVAQVGHPDEKEEAL